MSSEPDPRHGVSTHGTDAGDSRGESDAESPSTVICWACNRPIEDGPVRRWRGEPVHDHCDAERRCGVSLKPPEK